MNPIQRFVGRIKEFFTTQTAPYSQTLYTVSTRITRVIRSMFQPTTDWSRSDYDFWRKAWYCRAKGLELSGLFLKPIVNKIAAWVLGRAPAWRTGNKAADDALADWWRKAHPKILRGYRQALRQGDAFLVINPDLTITIIPPDLVDPIVADDDFGLIVGWRITQVLQHPTDMRRMTVIDEYRVDRRIHSVQIGSGRASVAVFPNPLGRPTIVHIPNGPDDGQTFGHAEAEALIELLHRYGETLEAAVEGNILQGRPTPVVNFATIQDMNEFWERYGRTQTHTLPDGSTENYKVLSVDLNQMLTLSNATFAYESPGSFTADTERLLGLFFYLLLEHTELPEFVLGNAISSSKASAETQMPVFEKFIEMRRGDVADWLVALAEIALGLLSLNTPGLGVPTEAPTLQWQKLTQDGRLTLDAIIWAFTEGLIDRRTALMLAPIDVQNIDEVLDAAEKEKQERLAQQTANMGLLAGDGDMDTDLEDEINALMEGKNGTTETPREDR